MVGGRNEIKITSKKIYAIQEQGLQRKALTIWKEYTKRKHNLQTPNFQDGGNSGRHRAIWVGGNLTDWGDYISSKIKNQEGEQNILRTKKIDSSTPTISSEPKTELSEIRTQWKNEYARIITNEIREGRKKETR